MSIFIQIDTQYLENYNWDGEGQAQWKFKGGTTYILECELPRSRSVYDLVAKMRDLVEAKGDGCQSIIVGWEILDRAPDDSTFPAWDQPVALFEQADGSVIAKAAEFDIANDDETDEYVRGELLKVEQWTMTPDQGRENYSCEYFGRYLASLSA